MSSRSTAVVRYQPSLPEVEQLTLVGFLAGYRGYTRDAYALDLGQFTSWCLQRGCHLFEVRRVDIECFTRDLEDAGKARATIARRLCTVCGFYRYAEEEGVIERSPGVHIRRPKVDYESHVVGLDRNEVGAILVTAGLSSARDHALVSLMALNGLRVAELVGIDIEALGLERGHRTLTVCARAARPSRCRSPRGSPAPSTWRSGNDNRVRSSSTPTGNDWTGMLLVGSCAGIARQAGIVKRVGPHTLRHAFITAALIDAGVPLRDVQEAASHADPRTTMPHGAAANPSTVTPPTSSPPSSPAHHADVRLQQRSGARTIHRPRAPDVEVRSELQRRFWSSTASTSPLAWQPCQFVTPLLDRS